ncbi:MAG TPA: efflux transporter outer membrane subunit [Saprospiraceae bacterium]|nr:efflux transporter outer membrane subunit [Saprospiraceae bacterium]
MNNKSLGLLAGGMLLLLLIGSCKVPQVVLKQENKTVPSAYSGQQENAQNVADLNWRTYFADSNLVALIDTALQNNQELNIVLQEIEILKNEVRARKGEYQPFVNMGAGIASEKPGRYTRFGALEEQLEVKPGKAFPEPLQDFALGLSASWEVDIWKKLRNAKKAAMMRYLAGTEGKNFMVTNLIAEIADSYYELLAMDNLLKIIDQNIDIQSNALKVVRQQKDAARVTQLAVNRFEAQLLNTQNLRFAIRQHITETENKINFLTGRMPRPVVRSSDRYLDMPIDSFPAGVPAQLLLNRPDIRQAELQLAASKLDVQVARANFLPSLGIRADLGFQAFNPVYLVNPHSILFNLAGDLMAPLVNKNALYAAYNTATAQQIQAVYKYEQSILNAYTDVLNQLSKVQNFNQSYAIKNREVEILNQSTQIANTLFNSARADYAEVLLTQREALEARMDVVEIKMKQLDAKVNIYRALGGGWK